MPQNSQIPNLDASARIISEEAQKRGIHCSYFEHRNLILMEKNGQQWYTCGSRTSFQSSVGLTIANNKSLTKKILNRFDLPTAKAVRVNQQSDLVQIKNLQFPLVMKPIDGAHGSGVVVGLKTYQEAEAAWQANPKIMIFEETLQGIEYRVVCIDYKFTAAAFRKPAHVIGDGQQTIAQLIAEKNQHPWRSEGHQGNLTKIMVDDLVTANLAEQNFKVDDVPAKDSYVFLRKTANLSTGGEAWDVTDEVCPENIALFEKIARCCDLNTIGIDIMCQTLTTPITQQAQAGVIEVNASPGLRMHHYPIKGKARNVAGQILDMVEKYVLIK